MVYIDTPQGNRLLAPLDWFSLEYARQETEVGALTLVLPAVDYDRGMFPKDGLIEIWNMPETGSPTLELDMLWLIRRVRYLGATNSWELTAYDLNHLLKRRVVDYNPGNTTYTELLGAGDDLGKQIISQNFGAGALDTIRSIATYLNIQANATAAPSVRISCSRQEVLKTLQNIAAAAHEQGTYLAFDTVVTSLPGPGTTLQFEFRSYVDQRGTDRRGLMYLGPDFGNLTEVEIDEDASNEITRAISTGQGVDAVQAVARADDTTRWEGSPFGLVEGVRSASSSLVATDLLNDAQAFLKQGIALKVITGKLVSMPGMEYGVDWNWGDRLEAQVNGTKYTCRVAGIHVTWTQAGREIEPTLVQVA